MSEGLNSIVQMQNITVDQVLENNHDKMIYIYDFFTMWSFYVELIDRDFEHNNMKLPSLLISLGEVPNNAPDIKFESEDQTNENFSDEFIVSSEEDYEDFSNN
jgi:hypothetical protein